MMGGGMQEIIRQASRLQRKMEQAREEIKDTEVEATAVGGKARAIVTCGGNLKRLAVDPELVQSEGLEMALDALVAATNAAFEAAEKKVEEAVTKATGGVKPPFGF